jgi:hypothetical protein
MASFPQPCPEFHEIVDFAVEGDPDRLILVADRLMAPGNVDDAQTPYAQGCRIVHIVAIVVWSTVPYRLAHGPEDQIRLPAVERAIYESRDAAHLPLVPET